MRGGHLEYLNLLKGKDFTPTWKNLHMTHMIITSKENNYNRKFGVKPNFCGTNIEPL